MYRDGRDVMVSGYHYIKSFADSPEKYGPGFHQYLRMAINPDHIPAFENINRIDYWVQHVEGWLAQDVLPISYEDLTYRFDETLTCIADYLEIPLQMDKSVASQLIRKIKKFVFNRNYGDSSAILRRNGVTGDWMQHFSVDDLSFFMEKARRLMEQLGYLTDGG